MVGGKGMLRNAGLSGPKEGHGTPGALEEQRRPVEPLDEMMCTIIESRSQFGASNSNILNFEMPT